MGYDPRVAVARKVNPTAKIGVIDPRPTLLNLALGADFVIANGIEMQNWLSDILKTSLFIRFFPLIKAPFKKTYRSQTADHWLSWQQSSPVSYNAACYISFGDFIQRL